MEHIFIMDHTEPGAIAGSAVLVFFVGFISINAN
jgi:hypothetical protein